MLPLRTKLALLLLVALSWVSLTTGCSSSPRRKVEATTPTPTTCAPDCYTESVCDDVLQVARAAAALEKALGTELRPQLRLRLLPTSVCNITRSKWEETSKELVQKMDNLDGSKVLSCKLKLPSDGAICAAFVKLSECAVARLRITYTKRECLYRWNHAGWLQVMLRLESATSGLDYLYESALSHRKSQWEAIKASMDKLTRIGSDGLIKRLMPDGCPPGQHCLLDYETIKIVNFGQQADVDDTWFMESSDSE